MKNNNISINDIKKIISKKFIKPLTIGCKYNMNKFCYEQKCKHIESVYLLAQANKSLNNAERLINGYEFIDGNVILRKSFEDILMAMEIQFDEGVYKEFINLNIVETERNYTRPMKIRSKFRTHMNDISKEMFSDFNRDEKLNMLTELYDILCNFTHSSLVSSIMYNIVKEQDKKTMRLLFLQNYYFIKLLLFLCLIYYTNDKKHFILENTLLFSYWFYLIIVIDNINKSSELFKKFDSYLYRNINQDYFDKKMENAVQITNEFVNLKNIVDNNHDKFINELKIFLS